MGMVLLKGTNSLSDAMLMGGSNRESTLFPTIMEVDMRPLQDEGSFPTSSCSIVEKAVFEYATLFCGCPNRELVSATQPRA